MACGCTDKKKLDFDYVRRLANAYSITNKIDIQIYYIIGYDGKTKYYDYEPVNGGRKLQVVEIIRFSEPKSFIILPDNEQSGTDIVDQEAPEGYYKTGTGKVIKVRKSNRTSKRNLDSDSGTILPID